MDSDFTTLLARVTSPVAAMLTELALAGVSQSIPILLHRIGEVACAHVIGAVNSSHSYSLPGGRSLSDDPYCPVPVGPTQPVEIPVTIKELAHRS